jgi:hypothetical protein
MRLSQVSTESQVFLDSYGRCSVLRTFASRAVVLDPTVDFHAGRRRDNQRFRTTWYAIHPTQPRAATVPPHHLRLEACDGTGVEPACLSLIQRACYTTKSVSYHEGGQPRYETWMDVVADADTSMRHENFHHELTSTISRLTHSD